MGKSSKACNLLAHIIRFRYGGTPTVQLHKIHTTCSRLADSSRQFNRTMYTYYGTIQVQRHKLNTDIKWFVALALTLISYLSLLFHVKPYIICYLHVLIPNKSTVMIHGYSHACGLQAR